jgi:hypothetical protein
MAKGIKLKAAIVMRTAPSSPAEKTTNPFLIRIKEVPQTRERKIRMIQARAWLENRPEVAGVSIEEVFYCCPSPGTYSAGYQTGSSGRTMTGRRAAQPICEIQ